MTMIRDETKRSPLSFSLPALLFLFSSFFLFVQCQEQIQKCRDNERIERVMMSSFVERIPFAWQRIEETENIKNILFKSLRTKLGIASNERKYSRLLWR